MTRIAGILRLFVGVYPPEDAASAMLAQLDGLALAAHTKTPLAQVHMTLQFIGETPARELDDVIESVQRSASGIGAITLQPTLLRTLPQRGEPRLIAMETTSPPALREAHRRLAQRLAVRVKPADRDRFLPHVTLCRFRNDARAERVELAVELPAFEVREIRLMKSRLTPQGAIHEQVVSVGL